MSQMNVSITNELATYVRKKVKSGRYNNASEVVRDALRRMEEEDSKARRLAQPTAEAVLADLNDQQLEEIRARVNAGIAAVDVGRFTEYDGATGLRHLAEKVKARGRKRLKGIAGRRSSRGT